MTSASVRLLVTLVLAGAVAGCGRAGPGAGTTAGSGHGAVTANARVVRVVDGDTIVADVGGQEERVRLVGIDTPESVKPNSPVECYGHEASDHTKQLLPARTPIRLVRDVEARDQYGRLLAYVYRSSDGLFVNMAMVSDGYANQYTFKPNVAHFDEFRRAVSAARSAGIGVWSACRDDPPFPADQH